MTVSPFSVLSTPSFLGSWFGAHFYCLDCLTTFPDKFKQNSLSEEGSLEYEILLGKANVLRAEPGQLPRR